MAVNQAAMRRRARIMRAVNVPMRAVLGLPFADAAQREPDAHLLHRPQEREGLPAAGQLRPRRRRAAHPRRRPLDAQPDRRAAGPDPVARPRRHPPGRNSSPIPPSSSGCSA